jgi:hypothetical protein
VNHLDQIPVWLYALAYPVLLAILLGVWLMTRKGNTTIHLRGLGVELIVREETETNEKETPRA